MAYEAWDISSAADHCLRVADEYGWEAQSPTPDFATFVKGERYVAIHLAINGGITRVVTDQGAYTGRNRKSYVIDYLRTQSA